MNTFKGKKPEEIKQIIGGAANRKIKWTRAVINDIAKGKKYVFDSNKIIVSAYRPFVKTSLYFSKELNEMQYQMPKVFHGENLVIAFSGEGSSKPFQVLAQKAVFNHDMLEKTQCLPLYSFTMTGKQDNITDWGLQQFREHYKNQSITREGIFHYTYAVLHNPAYRTKYALNLKREFPRLPFYEDFKLWATWGKHLMDLHINYETVKPFAFKRQDTDGYTTALRTKLKADKALHLIEIDSHTVLRGVPASAWEYKLGNRSALEWILDQYKEKTPKDATIREKFNTYHFSDYKESVIDLIRRVCTVSVETMKTINQMPQK